MRSTRVLSASRDRRRHSPDDQSVTREESRAPLVQQSRRRIRVTIAMQGGYFPTATAILGAAQ
jgi:hypothetical protein